jgi:hypothetical protein
MNRRNDADVHDCCDCFSFQRGSGSASRESVLANLQCFSANCLMKTIVAFIVGLLIATAAWAQIDKASGIVWLPNSIQTLNGKGYQMGLRHDGVVVWRWSPYR